MRSRPRRRSASGNSNGCCRINSGSSAHNNSATSTIRRPGESATTLLLGTTGGTNGPSPLLCPSFSSLRSSSLARPVHNPSSVPPRRTSSSSVPSSLLLVLVTVLNVSSLAVGLVIEKPFQESFQHVAASFGPDPLEVEPPIESFPLVEAQPRHACTPIQSSFNGAIALVERGTCDFTTKVMHAQEAGASAVVVADSKPRKNWSVIMRGTEENSQGIDIPAVLVSYETGGHLWSTRSWMPRRKLRASINAIGHIASRRPPPIGTTVEMLGIYLLLSVLLLAFSGVCGLLFALGLSWYQRGYRTREMRRLKSFVFSLRNRPRSAPGKAAAVVGKVADGRGTADASAEAASPADKLSGRVAGASPRQDSTGRSGGKGGTSGEDNNGMRAEDDTCAICLDAYEEGDKLTGLPCHHSFHTHCIRPWLSGKSALCPLCKKEAFSREGLFFASAPRLEAVFAELVALCTENLAILGLFFLASVACGVIAAKMSLRS